MYYLQIFHKSFTNSGTTNNLITQCIKKLMIFSSNSTYYCPIFKNVIRIVKQIDKTEVCHFTNDKLICNWTRTPNTQIEH